MSPVVATPFVAEGCGAVFRNSSRSHFRLSPSIVPFDQVHSMPSTQPPRSGLVQSGAMQTPSGEICRRRAPGRSPTLQRSRDVYFFTNTTSACRTFPAFASVWKFTSSRLKAGPGISSIVPMVPSAVSRLNT